MRMLLVAFVSLVVIRVISQTCPETTDTTPDHCPYFNNRYLNGTIPTLSSNSNCHWYRPSACCTPTEAQRLVGGLADHLFVEAPEECLDLLNLLVCYVCSPNQSLFYLPGELVICRDFCDRIFSSCSSAVWKGDTLSSHFDNSSHFCLSRGYTIEESYNLISCFNTANRIGSGIWTLFACLFISFLLMSKLSWRILILFLLLFSVFPYGEADHPETSVKSWAESLGSFTHDITWRLLQVNSLQSTFHSATYKQLRVNGSQLRDEMADQLSSVYQEATQAVRTLVSSTEQLFDRECTNTPVKSYTLDELRYAGLFYDSDTTIFPSDTNTSSVKISDSVDRNKLIAQEIALTANLTDTFISAKNNSQYITRLYFGSVKGFLREFPGREWERDIIGFPKEYDPRLQNWYHAATSRPKDIVVIIDCSSSMLENDRWQLALSTIELLLQTLTQEDFINIICSASSAYLNQESSTPEYIEARVMSSCSQDSLMPATSGVKRHLMDIMRREQPIGGSDHRDAFTLAFKLLWNQVSVSSRMCEPLVLFLTDGHNTDPVLCRSAAYFGTEEGALFVPGPNCLYNFNELYEHINLLEADYTTNKSRTEVRIVGFAISDTATTLPYNLSCSHGGFGITITNRLAIYSQLSRYFDYINQNSTGIEFLNPYGGQDGQLILTAVSPVYKECGTGRTLVGVVGVDYSLSAVQAVLSRARADGSYAFIINQFGEALFHPRIDPISRLIPNPIYPPLSSLENCPNTSNISICSTNYNPTNIESLIMRSSNPTDEFIVPSVPRLALRGDHQDGVEWTLGNSNYFYTPIANTSFILGLNLDDTFLNQSLLISLPPNESYTEPYYNIFSKYPQDTLDTFGLKPPNFCVATPFNVSTNQSLVTLAPISVCDSNRFPDPLTVYEYFSTYRNPNVTDSFEGCITGTKIFRERVLSSILLTSPIGVRWQGAPTGGVTWRYIGLENGILRIFPGVDIGTDYNPTVRPWYRRAVAEKNRLAISYVYKDAGGAGKTVTLSTAIFKSPQILNSTNCSYSGCQCTMDTECENRCIPELKACSTERIAGVTGFDYTYTEFSDTIHEHLNSLHFSDFCEEDTNCSFYIFDSQTFIILADEILHAPPYDTARYERVSLGSFQPEIVRDLVDSKGLLVEEVSFDFQSSCLYSSSSSLAKGINSSLFEDTGRFPPYQNVYSCLQAVRNFYINDTLLASLNGTVNGIISSNNCRNGNYYVSAIPGTNAFLLVLNNWVATKECALDPTGKSGPTLNLTGDTQCAGLFSEIQLTASYDCSTPIYTPPCQSASGGVRTLASSILIGLLFLLLCM